ncbi:DUF397 domain-containing protein [Streptomyces sp. NRRL B-1677]|uniref:DUF397 domain-containing protein n=1 Tax=Streptomyces klenkii TaxID=1420899 RepID=A0A3B0AHD0_9ACTN|nr:MULTISPECIES: DUF397 domain-containing protein [Streptomyces]MBF6050143.1 DUF397 domain-containing protein [Streptomyces sp. NRRL B-1677]RKN59664.1 DUF397 domain-containing protein [Streptomyces klenkii]
MSTTTARHPATPQDSRRVWRKSSHSSGNGACVEVATDAPLVEVRDSKDPSKPHLHIAPQQWQTFLTHTAISATY